MSNTQTAVVPALVIKRTFNAPRERVFNAMTSTEIIPKWFGGPGTTVGKVEFDAREGGRYRIQTKNSKGEDFNVGGVITSYRPPERLAYTFRWEENDRNDEHETLVTFEFIEHGNQTEMVFTHESLKSEESRERHSYGWNASFDNVETLL